ncbi:CBS domain-containing protein [Streptomyces bambusae]|uniref:Zinc metalloprotease n=2 Tax=Streptomyces bambusae TaxID=1550616 RepID=A0ABS6YXV3_9ACTN|nr:CBS domain-containing protein [Streptomyces bambusae]
MRASFPLGRVAGVRVGLHWSALGIFWIIALGLASGSLPHMYPGRPWVAYWAVGLGAAAVFLASLLAHELAHAVVARRNEVDVDEIVLWLLGGMARIRTEAPSPAAELRIAGAGPLVSLVLGGLFALAAWALDASAGGGLVVEALIWLAAINILLALFNTVPAAPLDGGRLLRAFLWWRGGDPYRASMQATAAGRVFGWLLVAGGLLMFARGDVFGGLWFVMIGWFLIAAATAEGGQAQLRALLAGLPVRQVMTPDPVTVAPGLTIAEFLADARYRYRHSAYPVTGDDGTPLGLLTLRGAGGVPEGRRPHVTVAEAMLPLTHVTVVDAGTALTELTPQLAPGAEHRTLVTDQGRLIGIVSASDVGRVVSWLTTTTPRRRNSG